MVNITFKILKKKMNDIINKEKIRSDGNIYVYKK